MSSRSGPAAWMQHAIERGVVLRSLKVAVVVGTLLALINHGDAFVAGAVSTGAVIKMLLTYIVPYGVSTYGSVGAILAADGRTDRS